MTGKETVIDAYCGIGTIGMAMASKAGKVIGVELNKAAVRDAKENAKRNHINNIHFIAADATEYMTQMSDAGKNTIISMAIVFAVLILISLIITCFKIFPYLEEKKKNKATSNVKSAETTVVETKEENVPQTDDSELIAVIAAAIAASEGTSTSDFVVRSINRR